MKVARSVSIEITVLQRIEQAAGDDRVSVSRWIEDACLARLGPSVQNGGETPYGLNEPTKGAASFQQARTEEQRHVARVTPKQKRA